MRIGSLRQRITIQRMILSENYRKETITTWANWATGIAASVVPQSGRDFYRAKQENVNVEGLLTIRYLDGVDRTMRIKMCGRVLEIIWVRDLQERRVEMQIAYKEAI